MDASEMPCEMRHFANFMSYFVNAADALSDNEFVFQQTQAWGVLAMMQSLTHTYSPVAYTALVLYHARADWLFAASTTEAIAVAKSCVCTLKQLT